MYRRYLKRCFDFSIAITAIALFSPLMALVALLVRLKLGSPILFVQPRPGLNEKIFNMYKFRTMTSARDSRGQLLPDSERLTSFGRLLRSTSLDELPELWNVVKGDMSLVGPRPLLVKYLPHFSEHERRRHTVRPGVTGLAQVSGRNNLPWAQRFVLDVRYVDNLSFVLDCKILLSTVARVVSRKDVTECASNLDFKDLDIER
ncbi:MAG: sugar transferase [Firmicutes bacterium]|nr:sugar transferase [Dethiobacter sp.]MBS3888392.1 sugar transferase [Bacillota bacterium]MBS4054674.1 sugar transferase [Thermaerobacter sp.]